MTKARVVNGNERAGALTNGPPPALSPCGARSPQGSPFSETDASAALPIAGEAEAIPGEDMKTGRAKHAQVDPGPFTCSLARGIYRPERFEAATDCYYSGLGNDGSHC